MTTFSRKGWDSDTRIGAMSSDELERYGQNRADDELCRHDKGTPPRRAKRTSPYIKGFGDAGLIKTDFNTDVQRADSGNPDACYRVGMAYFRGECGASRNHGRALIYLECAFEGGYKDALAIIAEIKQENYRAAQLYQKGLELERSGNLLEALARYKEAKNLDNAEARCRINQIEKEKRDSAKKVEEEKLRQKTLERRKAIGHKIESEKKLFKDRENALLAGFAHGDKHAAIDLSRLYLSKRNSLPYFEKARDWLNKARDLGLIESSLLTEFAEFCDMVPCSFYTSAQMRTLAEKYYKLAAQYGGCVEKIRLRNFRRRRKNSKV